MSPIYEEINDNLYDDYIEEIDSPDRDYDDYDDCDDTSYYIPRHLTWQKSMEAHGFDNNETLWAMFKTRLFSPNWHQQLLFKRTDEDSGRICKLIHETEKAILLQEFDDEKDLLIPNKAFWVPKSLVYFKRSEPKALKIYAPWFFKRKYI